MSYAIVLVFDGVSETDYWAVNSNLGAPAKSALIVIDPRRTPLGVALLGGRMTVHLLRVESRLGGP